MISKILLCRQLSWDLFSIHVFDKTCDGHGSVLSTFLLSVSGHFIGQLGWAPAEKERKA